MGAFCYAEIGGDELQEDIEQRSMTLAINTSKLTGRVLKSAISKDEEYQSQNSTVNAAQISAKAAKKAAEGTKKAGKFFSRHKKGFLIAGIIAAVIAMFLSLFSSCSVMLQGGVSSIAATTYPSADSEMLAAEARYCGMEAELQSYLDTYESAHSYDE